MDGSVKHPWQGLSAGLSRGPQPPCGTGPLTLPTTATLLCRWHQGPICLDLRSWTSQGTMHCMQPCPGRGLQSSCALAPLAAQTTHSLSFFSLKGSLRGTSFLTKPQAPTLSLVLLSLPFYKRQPVGASPHQLPGREASHVACGEDAEVSVDSCLSDSLGSPRSPEADVAALLRQA